MRIDALIRARLNLPIADADKVAALRAAGYKKCVCDSEDCPIWWGPRKASLTRDHCASLNAAFAHLRARGET